jgi:hypothetical protein
VRGLFTLAHDVPLGELMGITHAHELAEIIASVGLAQNKAGRWGRPLPVPAHQFIVTEKSVNVNRCVVSFVEQISTPKPI